MEKNAATRSVSQQIFNQNVFVDWSGLFRPNPTQCAGELILYTKLFQTLYSRWRLLSFGVNDSINQSGFISERTL